MSLTNSLFLCEPLWDYVCSGRQAECPLPHAGFYLLGGFSLMKLLANLHDLTLSPTPHLLFLSGSSVFIKPLLVTWPFFVLLLPFPTPFREVK